MNPWDLESFVRMRSGSGSWIGRRCLQDVSRHLVVDLNPWRPLRNNQRRVVRVLDAKSWSCQARTSSTYYLTQTRTVLLRPLTDCVSLSSLSRHPYFVHKSRENNNLSFQGPKKQEHITIQRAATGVKSYTTASGCDKRPTKRPHQVSKKRHSLSEYGCDRALSLNISKQYVECSRNLQDLKRHMKVR